MAESTFNLFGPITKNDVRVGYISTDRGYIQGVSVCDANSHAKKNPGQTFIHKPNRKTVNFLNINEVNKLGDDPGLANKDTSCPEGLDMNAEPAPVSVRFMGGGGIGVVGNPVISPSGQVMALHLVNGGFGYQYPPIVHIHDESGIGAGALVKVGVGTTFSNVKYYSDKEEFEEYNICDDVYSDTSRSDGGIDSKIAKKRSPYGRRWSPDGRDLGPWNPGDYTDDTKSPFDQVLEDYLKQLDQAGKDWFTTRKQSPLKVTSEGKTTKEFYKVQHWTWGSGSKTPLSLVPFEIHWASPHRTKGLGFEFVARDGSHSFKIVDTSKKGHGSRKDVYQVKENLTYDVKPIGKRPSKKKGASGDARIIHLAELGLLQKLGPTAGKNLEAFKSQTGGEGDKVFADFLDTLDDADDLQVQAQRGKFTASNPREVEGLSGKRTTYDLTYRLETGRQEMAPSFMNKYAISPKPPSNIKGSDFAGHWFAFEWDLDFPYDGEYIIRTARDNRSRIYFDGISYTDKLQTFTGTNPESNKRTKKIGHANKITFKKGPKKLRLEVYNEPEMGTVYKQQPSPPAKSEVTFKIVGSSWFTDGVRIEELDVNEIKDFTFSDVKGQLNASHTRKVEFGRKYKVVFTSKESLNIQLRTKGSNVIQMENAGDGSYDDVVIHASSGQFTDLKGNTAYFSVPHPPKQTGKSQSDSKAIAEVFNTVDYINKANRQLWRTNVFDRGGFLNDYGVCPFDTNLLLKDNPYAGTHQIVWPNVNFPISGNYDIQVAVDDNVDITIGNEVKINKKGFIDNTSTSTGTLKLTRFINAGRHTITADLDQKPGGSYGFREPGGKKVNKSEVTFKVTSAAKYANSLTIPGLFSVGKEYDGPQINQTITKQLDTEKEYNVILNSEQSKNVRVRIKDKGKRLEMEEWKDGDWQDVVCTVNNGEFYNSQGNQCKFRVDRTIKGINPMALAINIEATYTAKKEITPKSWNENPMGLALTIEAPVPPIPQEPVPKAEGRCPNNPYWTTRFPGSKERWYPVKHDGWGELLNKHGISPLPPYNKHINPVAEVSFDVFWSSPHRKKGLGYRFSAQDGSHSFTIIDSGRTHDGTKTETHKVKLNTNYEVKAIGRRTAEQGSKIGPDALGGHDNSRVVELAEQGLLKTQLGVKGGLAEGKTNKLDANKKGTGDKIFADFLDTLDDADDLQIQAGAGQFTAANPREVQGLRGKRTTYDLTYRVSEVPPNDAGNFTNSWTKSFEFGGYYKAQLEVDDIGELWIDDQKVLDLDRRKNKTFDEKLIWIDGPTSNDELKKTGPVNHDIKVVVENFKSQKTKTINAKVFNTIDWIGGGATKAQKKIVSFKITSGSMFANSIKIPELGIHESKPFTPVSQGQRGQIKVTREKEVEVNKVYDVEFFSSNKGSQKDWGIKYNGVKRPFRVIRKNKTIQFDDNPGNGFDVNASFTISRGNVKFSDDGERLIVKGREATFTLDWNDSPGISGRALQSIQIGNKTWRITKDKRGSVTQTVKFSSGASGSIDNTGNIKLRNDGESVVRMEDHTDNDWTDIICAATEGRFFDFNGNKCKYVVGSATRVGGGAIQGGTTRDGVTYQGPHLFHHTDSRWGRVINKEGVSPISSATQSLSDPNANILGWKKLTWKNVDFPKTGKYQISFVADNRAKLFIDDKEYLLAPDNYGLNEYNYVDIEVGKGTHDIRVEIFNANHGYRATADANDMVFLNNPTGVALRIYTKMTVSTGTYKSWRENPIGLSAKLIPPPCPKPSKGKGVVKDPVVVDGGNRYPVPPGPGYPVRLRMKEPVILNPGINYDCSKDTIRVEPSNGVKLSLCQCGPFGRVEKVCIEGEGYFTEPPEVIIDSPTGVNLDIALQFEPTIVPPDIPDIIQVTDLVGLKRTGYYKGKPYYGAVFYENGVKYSGWYRTAGEMVQVYDTMQESINAEVTTPASAIQRQGSDPGGNDPRLNIPGTPENLT